MFKSMLLAVTALAAVPAVAQTAAPAPAAPRITYIQAGQLLARPGQPPRGNSTIIVRDGKVAEVRDGFVAARSRRDRHRPEGPVRPARPDRHARPPARHRRRSAARAADRAQHRGGRRHAVRRRQCARDAAARASPPFAIWAAIRAASGRCATRSIAAMSTARPSSTPAHRSRVTGGHGDPLNGIAEPFAHAIAETVENTCDGPADCTRATRRQVGLGAQVVKITATGGVLSNVSGGLGRAFTIEEMRAIVETAHGLGRKVAAHSHAADGTKGALTAGVDSIEHGSFLDDEAIAMLKRTGAYLVPTELAPVAALAQARAGVAAARHHSQGRSSRRRDGRKPPQGVSRRASSSPSAPTPACRSTATMRRNSHCSSTRSA